MATRRTKTAAAELAEAVADKIAEQARQLTIEHWMSIQKTMDADEGKEIKLSFSTTLTHRPAEEGTVASKDSRIVTTLAFSLGKETGKTESPYPDPQQMELGSPGSGEPNIDEGN